MHIQILLYIYHQHIVSVIPFKRLHWYITPVYPNFSMLGWLLMEKLSLDYSLEASFHYN